MEKMTDLSRDEYEDTTKGGFFEILKSKVLPLSRNKVDWMDAKEEWDVIREDEYDEVNAVCTCTKTGLRFLYTIENRYTSHTLEVGSVCVNQFKCPLMERQLDVANYARLKARGKTFSGLTFAELYEKNYNYINHIGERGWHGKIRAYYLWRRRYEYLHPESLDECLYGRAWIQHCTFREVYDNDKDNDYKHYNYCKNKPDFNPKYVSYVERMRNIESNQYI